jgi:hypothetical protein
MDSNIVLIRMQTLLQCTNALVQSIASKLLSTCKYSGPLRKCFKGQRMHLSHYLLFTHNFPQSARRVPRNLSIRVIFTVCGLEVFKGSLKLKKAIPFLKHPALNFLSKAYLNGTSSCHSNLARWSL